MNNKQGMRGAFRFFVAQLCVMLVFSGILWLFLGMHAAMSVLWGGFITLLPNVYFATVLFRYHGAQAAKKIVTGFYQGEAMKVLLTAGLFVVTFKFMNNVIPLYLFAGLIGAQLMIWFAPLLFNNK